MTIQSNLSATGRRLDNRRHLLCVAQAQLLALPATRPVKSIEEREQLAVMLGIQNAMLRKELSPEMAKELLGPANPPAPAPDFTSLEQRIFETMGAAANHPYGGQQHRSM
jgi:hypothetical protein